MTSAIDNPYWDAVKDRVDRTGSLWRTPSVDGLGLFRRNGEVNFERYAAESRRLYAEHLDRHSLAKRFSWTITDPDTLAFVAEHSGGRLVDPMAGTGYWGWVLAQLGVDVVSSDIEPSTNHYHDGAPLHSTVDQLAGADAVKLHADRTLLLFEQFTKEWSEVADRVPVQWDGLHDVVTVYERNSK